MFIVIQFLVSMACRLKFVAPFQLLCAGSTMSGKSSWVFKLIEYNRSMITPSPDRIVYCYSIYQKKFDDLKRKIPYIEFINGLPPNEEDFFDRNKNNLLIFDDLAAECNNNSRIAEWFVKGSHHLNTSLILITQNLFSKGKESRTISLNCSYLLIFKSPRDSSQILYLSRQIFPKKKNFLVKAYEMATERKAHSYILIDCKQSQDDQLRIRTNVLPCEEPMIIFVE